jgi:hypothetical protein
MRSGDLVLRKVSRGIAVFDSETMVGVNAAGGLSRKIIAELVFLVSGRGCPRSRSRCVVGPASAALATRETDRLGLGTDSNSDAFCSQC